MGGAALCFLTQPLRIGVGGPVGSGKTALVAALCRSLAARWSVAVVTNDIYTTEDAEILLRRGRPPARADRAVQTGCCPHTAIRDDISANLEAVEELERAHSRSRARPHRVRRRQPDGDVQLRPGRRADLRHRRRRRRQGPAQGRPGHHAVGPAGHQQDRPGPVWSGPTWPSCWPTRPRRRKRPSLCFLELVRGPAGQTGD